MSQSTSKKRNSPLARQWLAALIVAAVALAFAFPVYFMVSSAFKAENEILAIPIHVVPYEFAGLDEFRRAMEIAPLGNYVFNSALVSVVNVVCTLLFSAMAGSCPDRDRRGQRRRKLRRPTTIHPGAQVARGPVALDAHAVAGGRPGHADERLGCDSLLTWGSVPTPPTVCDDQLAEEFGDDTASFVAKMLVGIYPGRGVDPKIFERLVAALGPEQQSIGVRELALDTLKQLTGRDDLGYDPDHAEGKGLNAWKDLQRQGKLRYSATRGKAK